MVIKETFYFKLFSFCIPVRGKKEGAIYNLQKSKILTVPLQMIDFIEILESNTVKNVESFVNGKELFEKYLSFLTTNYLGFLTDTPENFPKLPTESFTPEIIRNIVLEVDMHKPNVPMKVTSEINKLLCKHIEIRILGKNLSYKFLTDLLAEFSDTILRSIVLVLSCNISNLHELNLNKLYRDNPKIRLLKIFCLDKKEDSNAIFKDIPIVFYNEPFKNARSKTFPINKYIVNSDFFNESLNFNPYYFKKVCIDSKGFIKNCLGHSKSYGNINESLIGDVINETKLQELWYAKHDLINGIKDSPFRYAMLISSNLKRNRIGFYDIV